MSIFLRGVKWSFILQVIDIVGKVLFTSILARILSPNDFGIVSMVTILTALSYIIINFGFSQYIITNKNLENEELSSIFWFNALTGLLIALIICLSAKMIASFYNKPELINICYAVSLIYIFSSCSIVPNALLNRSMEFKKLAIRTFIGSIISYFIAFILAINGAKYWSLVFQLVFSEAFNFLILLKLSRWLPKLYLNGKQLLKGAKHSSYLFMHELSSYFTRNIDNVLVGKFFGAQNLAIYTKSFALINLPLQSINAILFRVSIPYLSKIAHDKAEVENLFYKLLINISFLVFVLMGTVLLASKQFVIVFFGEQWLEMIPLIKWFGVAAMINGIYRIVSMLLVSIGDVKLNLKIGLIHKAILIVSIFSGVFISFKFLVIFRSVAEIFMFIVSFIFIYKKMKLKFRKIVSLIFVFFGIICLFIIVSQFTNKYFSGSFSMFYSFLILLYSLIFSGLVSYFLLMYATRVLAPDTLISIRSLRNYSKILFNK